MMTAEDYIKENAKTSTSTILGTFTLKEMESYMTKFAIEKLKENRNIHQKMSKKAYNVIANNDIDLVARLVIETTGLNIFKNTRRRDYIEARSVFYVIMKLDYNATYSFIMDYMHENHKTVTHATMVHAVNSFEDYATFNNYLQLARESILNRVTEMRYSTEETV